MNFPFEGMHPAEYQWKNVNGFTDEEMRRYQAVLESNARLIIEFSQQGGFDYAASF